MKKILLVGNPNTGKTTLLNTLTKSHEHTGNWHGVTVEEKEKFFVENGEKVAVVDLPGLYSLNALSFEEGVAIKHIFSTPCDLIVCACDASTMRKNLYLALELLLAG
ncbi:MAG: FeoB small GTPase domain-containing protein, partial [Clostridia bacterium]